MASNKTVFKRPLIHLSVSCATIALLFLVARPSIASVTQMGGTPILSTDTIEAKGRQETLLKVPAPGRYAVTATSDQGTAVSIINKMTGPGPSSGIPGEENGRIDLLLDEGEYKIIARSHKDGSGKAKLEAHTFTELNAPGIPLLIENKPVTEQLGDFEQRSYWLRITQATDIILEATGRNLSDLRFWKNGSWLYDALPTTETLDPLPGRPLRAYRMALKLQPGLYLLTAYGGPSEPWAEADELHPFYLRYGIPKLPEAGRKRFEIGPAGIDRFLIPAQASYYRLELPESVEASLRVETFSVSRPFNRGGRSVRITKKSRLPVAEINTRPTSGYKLVTVTGSAGQPFILQHFDARDSRQFRKSGAFWLSTIHSGDPHDSVDATALLFEHSSGRSPIFRTEDVIELGPDTPWSRRFNLLEEGTVYLKILQAGKYTVNAPGSDILIKIEPFMITRPRDYREPDFTSPGKAWDLDRGYHVLTAKPLKKGIVTLSISAEKKESGVLDKTISWIKSNSPDGMFNQDDNREFQTPSAIFEKIDLKYNTNYTLYINRQPGVRAGMVLRPLPLDLSDALPLSLLPGQTVSVPFRLQKGPGTIRAIAEDGSPLQLSLGGGEWSDSVRAGSSATLQVRNPGDNIAVASVWLEEDWDRPETPLGPLPSSALRTLPKFTNINDTAPLYFDLNRRANRTFMIKVREPAFYNLESTGLLDIEGNLRAKIITSLGRDSGSGTGRNFFVGRYLREGDYQVTVAARGQSAGHLGLGLTKSALSEGGDLREGIPARATLLQGQGIVYTLNVSKPGTFRLTGYGLDRILPFRLEDKEGWPLITPNRPMDRNIDLPEGTFRIVLLPEKVKSRRVVLVSRVSVEGEVTGHGPHSISLNTQYENVWQEPEKGNKRLPDVWTFDLAASADIAVSMTGEMEGKLVQVAGKGHGIEPVAIPTTGWEGRLNEGKYRFEAVCSRVNNRVPYKLRISTNTLLAGLSRRALAPVDILLSVGSGGLIEVSSFGKEDVRARLINREGIPVARQDDRPNDWNFQINRQLDPGDYTLQVRPVGRRNASFTASMEAFGEQEGNRIKMPAQMEIIPADGITVLPMKIKGSGVINLAVRSDENVGLALDRESGDGGWETVWSGSGTTIAAMVPIVDPKTDLRLRLWSMDRRNLPVLLTADLLKIKSVPEAQIIKGIMAPVSKERRRAFALAAVETTRPGLFVAESGNRNISGTDSAMTPFTMGTDGFLRAGSEGFWFLAEDTLGSESAADDDRTDATDTIDFTMGMGAFIDDTDDSQDSLFRISARRYTLSGHDHVQLALTPGEKVTLDVEGGKGLVLVEATSLGGQPGVRFSENSKNNGVVMAVAKRSAAAVLLGAKSPSAMVFNAGDTVKKMNLKLTRRVYPNPQSGNLSWGQSEGQLEKARDTSVVYSLPPGNKRVRISASIGVTAALLENDRVTSVSWAGTDSLDEMLITEADQLVLMLTGNDPARYALQVLPHGDKGTFNPLTESKPFEHRFIDGGTARIRVKGIMGARLKVEGTVDEVTLVTSSGQVLNGTDLALTEGDSELIIRHDPGYVITWIENGKRKTGLWGENDPSSSRSLSKPEIVPLTDDSAAIEFDTDKPSVVHIRTNEPVVIRSMVPGSLDRTEVHPDGGRVDLYLPEGRGEAWIRGLGGTTLTGTTQVSFTPVIRTGEGLGPEILIPGGESRFFSFKVDRRGQVGIGVRGDSDVVRCLLQDMTGKTLGEGVVQMPTLEPGEYLIRLTVPPDMEPVRARPAVVGLTLPGTGPPEEEIRKYLEMAGMKGGQ